MNLFMEFTAWFAGWIGDKVIPRKFRKDDVPPTMPIDIMNTDRIKSMQSKLGVVVDGFWGPKSEAACRAHLKGLMHQASGMTWPATDQGSLTRFYGVHGDESMLVNLDVDGLGVKYDGKPVKTIRCHKKVSASLRRILESLSKTHPEILARYAGCYNNRNMRGGSTPSLHARGAAIDLAPETNGNHDHWPSRADMPLEVMEAFAREGWMPAGAFWSRDAMHFQATK